MRNRLRLLPLLVLPLALSISASAETKGALLEKTVDVPRATKVPVDIAFEKAALVNVESINDPRERDIKDARENDPKDVTFMLLRFHYRNADYVSHKVKLRAVLMDGSDGVLAEGGRTGTLDPQQTDDTLTFPIKVKTLDWPNAAKMKVIATFLR
jgi:hypothetical protein